MLEETGYVISKENDYIWVETARKSACQSCMVSKGCGTSVISKLYGDKVSRFRTRNTMDARVGDEIVIGMQEGGLIKGSLVVYALPLVLLLLFAILTEQFVGVSSHNSELLVVLAGITGLISGFVIVRWFSRRIANDARYQPVILRRTGRHVSVNVML
jgi:sigma-E factor negative regulatory protein RseC